MPATLTNIEPREEFAAILRQSDNYGTGQGVDTSDRLNSWFDTLMLQSGLNLAPTALMMLCVISAIALGGLIFVVQENFLTTAVGALIGFTLPLLYAVITRSRRQSTILGQIPPMLEELARAARTGRSVEQSFLLVAEDTPAPLGTELQLAAARLKLGMPIRSAVSELPYRTGLMTLNLLVTTLAVQQQTGGDLVTVLDRLSRTVRERISFLGRLRAATAASRATAILMIVLPPAILAFFCIRDPNYLNELMGSTWGRNATLLAVALEVIGALWVLRILSNSARS